MIRAALLLALLATPALAQDPVAEVLRAVEELDAARAAISNPGAEGEARVQTLAQSVRAYETGLAALREAARRAELVRRARAEEFAGDSAEVSRVLAALQAAGAPTTPRRLLHPQGPQASAHAAMLMADLVPGLQMQARASARELAQIATLEATIAAAERALSDGADGARSARAELIASLRGREALPAHEGPIAQALAKAALSLEEAAIAFSETPSEADLQQATVDFETLLGALPPPVSGAVLGDGWGNGNRPGITFATRPRALVTTPAAATVRYSGTLQGYGNVIILEPAAHYLLIVTGLGEPLVNAGQVLPPGAALGLMGGIEDDQTAPSNGRGEVLTESLYVETRANGDSVDPATWFALDKER